MPKENITISKEDLVALVNDTAKDIAEKAVADIKAENAKQFASQKFSVKGSYASLSDEAKAKLGSKEKMVSFIKALYNKDVASLAEFKSNMNEGTGSAGGYLVPTEFAAEVFRVVEDFGLVPKLATKFPMAHAQLNVPRVSATVTVGYPGEATAGTPSQPTLQQVQLIAKTLVGITPLSNELLEDANISVVDLLVELFAEAIAGQLDLQGLVGTGSPFTGVMSDTGVTVVTAGSGDTTFTKVATPDYCRQLIANVKPWSLQGACFVMHRSIWQLVQTTKTSGSGEYFASAAQPILSPSAVQGYPNAIAGTLWGYPVYLSDKMPDTTLSAISTKVIMFGNLKHIFLGMRDEMGILISEHATVGTDNLFSANMSAVRVTHRHAVAVGLPTAFAVLKTAAA